LQTRRFSNIRRIGVDVVELEEQSVSCQAEAASQRMKNLFGAPSSTFHAAQLILGPYVARKELAKTCDDGRIGGLVCVGHRFILAFGSWDRRNAITILVPRS